MKKVYRAHPFMIGTFIKPFLFVLVLPLITALLQYFTDRKITNILALEIIAFSIILFIGIARFVAFKLIIDGDTLIIKSGVIFRRTSRIKISRISSFQTERNPIDMLFFSVTCRINTEAGALKRSDFKFKLSRKNSIEVSRRLYADKTVSRVRFSAFRVAIMAAASSSAATGIIIGVPIINRVGKLLGIGIEQMLFDEINNVSSRLQNYFPPIVNSVSLIILLAYGVSFAYSFIKNINFKLSFGEDRLTVRSGFFVKIKTAFRRSKVNNVKIEQTPLMRFLRRYSMKVSVGGFDDAKSVSQIIVPSARRKSIGKDLCDFFPTLLPNGNRIKPKDRPAVKNLFMMWPCIYFAFIINLAIYFTVRFPDFSRLIQFFGLVSIGVLILFTLTCIYEYRYGALELGENVFARSNFWFSTREMYCPKENIGQVKVTRFPLDRKLGICRVRLTVCSENADTIRVRHLEFDQAKKEIEECFNLPDII